MTETYFVIRSIPYEGQMVSEYDKAKDAYDYLQSFDSDDEAYVTKGKHVKLIPTMVVIEEEG